MKDKKTYELELNALRGPIERNISGIPRVTAEERRDLVAKVNEDIDEVESIINEMSISGSFSGKDWGDRVEELEEEVDQWKKQLQAASVQVQYDAAHSELISGGSLLSAAVTADDHRRKMEHSSQLMNQASDHVTNMNRIAQETIEIGADVLEMLDDQGNQVTEGRSKLRDINSSLDRSQKTMRKIGRTLMTNKIFLVLGVVVVLVIIGVLLFMKFGRGFLSSSPDNIDEE